MGHCSERGSHQVNRIVQFRIRAGRRNVSRWDLRLLLTDQTRRELRAGNFTGRQSLVPSVSIRGENVVCAFGQRVRKHREHLPSDTPSRDEREHSLNSCRAMEQGVVIQIDHRIAFTKFGMEDEQLGCQSRFKRHECKFNLMREPCSDEGEDPIAGEAVAIEQDHAAQSMNHANSISRPKIS